jgi:hypothetical protein
MCSYDEGYQRLFRFIGRQIKMPLGSSGWSGWPKAQSRKFNLLTNGLLANGIPPL